MAAKKLAFLAAFTAVLILMLTALGCNSSRVQKSKLKESTTQNEDSSRIVKGTTTTNNEKDSSGVNKNTEGSETEVEIEFGDKGDSTVVKTVIGEDTITTVGKPVKLKYKRKKETQQSDSARVISKGSTSDERYDSTGKKNSVQHDRTESNKDKKTSRVPWLLIVIGTLTVGALLFFIIKRKL